MKAAIAPKDGTSIGPSTDTRTRRRMVEHEKLIAEARLREQQEMAATTTSSSGGAASDWPVLVPLGIPELPRLPAEVLPSWAGAFAAALASATETPAELAVGMILAAAAVPCARRLRLVVHPGHCEPCNVWIAVSLPPGNRKSCVQAAVTAPLMQWEREAASRIAADITAAESLNKTLHARAAAARSVAARSEDPEERTAKTLEAAEIEASIQPPPIPPQLWTSDSTAERLGIILSDQHECLAWLSSEAGLFDMLGGRYSRGVPNLDLVLKAWSGDSERIDRAGREPIYLQCPRLTIGLSPQPEVLRGLSEQPGFRGRGLLGRFLYLLPPSPLGYRSLDARRPGANVPEHLEADYRAGLRSMLDWPAAIGADGDERPHDVRLSPAAYEEWLTFAQEVEAGMRPGGEYEEITDLAGKIPGMAARIAALLHGIEHAHGHPWEIPVAPGTMTNALHIASVSLKHGLAVMQMLGSNPTMNGAIKVWAWLQRGRRTEATVRDVFQALKGTFERVAALHNALEVLEERGYIKLVEAKTEQGVGRPPSPWITVRPDIRRGWK